MPRSHRRPAYRRHLGRAVKTGDPVWIGCDDRTVEGTILLASGNERSLMLGFEAILGGHVGVMPVLFVDGVYRSVVTGEAVAVVPRTEPT
jgi:hypothetical protein